MIPLPYVSLFYQWIISENLTLLFCLGKDRFGYNFGIRYHTVWRLQENAL